MYALAFCRKIVYNVIITHLRNSMQGGLTSVAFPEYRAIIQEGGQTHEVQLEEARGAAVGRDTDAEHDRPERG